MKSTSGYVFIIGSCVICWNAKKQEVVAQLIAEAKYVSLAVASNQAIWLKKLLTDFNTNKAYQPTFSAIQ